jgi:hypothetical protein
MQVDVDDGRGGTPGDREHLVAVEHCADPSCSLSALSLLCRVIFSSIAEMSMIPPVGRKYRYLSESVGIDRGGVGGRSQRGGRRGSETSRYTGEKQRKERRECAKRVLLVDADVRSQARFERLYDGVRVGNLSFPGIMRKREFSNLNQAGTRTQYSQGELGKLLITDRRAASTIEHCFSPTGKCLPENEARLWSTKSRTKSSASKEWSR